MATTQQAVQVTSITPIFTVDDLQKSIAFYEALGFTVGERWEDNGALLGVMLSAGKTQIGLNQDDWKKGRDRKKGVGVRLFLATTRVVWSRGLDIVRHFMRMILPSIQTGSGRD